MAENLFAPPNVIVTIGQSLNVVPDNNGPQSLYGLISSNYAGRATVVKGHIGGIAWLQWKKAEWQTFYDYWALKGTRVIYAMCGGTTDYASARTGALCYADEGLISAYLKSLNPQVRMIGSTTNPSTTLTGGNETNRQNGNSLVLADASTYFDRIVDYAGVPQMSDPTNLTYYQADGTHPTAAGQTYMFSAVKPAIDALLI